jgi:hypothetical protein
MTASEIAMGRYMRAPDHPVVEEPVVVVTPSPAPTVEEGEDAYSAAFAEEVLKEAATEGGNDGGTGATGVAAPAGAAGGAAAAPAGDEVVVAQPEGETPAEGGAAGGAPAAGSEKPAVGGDAAGAGAAATGSEAHPAQPAETPPDADDVLKRLAAEIAKQGGAKQEVEAPPPATDAEPERPLFTEAEQASIDHFAKEWPEEHEAVRLMGRDIGVSAIKFVFESIAPEMRQIRDMVVQMSTRMHYGDLVESVGEISEDEIAKVKSWAEGQDQPYLQKAYLGVIKEGTADEVANLVSRYREETGTQPAPQPAAEPAKKPVGDTELSGVAKQAAASLAPVGTKRSVVQNPDDAQDFDAAWDKYLDMKV